MISRMLGSMGDAEDDDLVILTSCRDTLEADLLKGWLESNGVFCFAQGAGHRALLGALGAYIEVNLMVRRADGEEAQRLLAEFRAGRDPWPEAAEIGDPDRPDEPRPAAGEDDGVNSDAAHEYRKAGLRMYLLFALGFMLLATLLSLVVVSGR
jgi:hypothetical protein